jgi:hypothetical protein
MTAVLDHLDKSNLLPPLMIIEVLARSPTVRLSAVKVGAGDGTVVTSFFHGFITSHPHLDSILITAHASTLHTFVTGHCVIAGVLLPAAEE